METDIWKLWPISPTEYQAYVNEAYTLASRFAKSRFIHYTIIQAATYLAFHHRALWSFVRADSLDTLAIPVESYPNTIWTTIKSALLQMEPGQMRKLLEPTCERLVLILRVWMRISKPPGGANTLDRANEELVKDLRIALGAYLGLDAILQASERESFHRELCLQMEKLFDIEIERRYFNESTYHHMFPDSIASHCPLEIIRNIPVGEVVHDLVELQKSSDGSTVITILQASNAITVVASNDPLGSVLFRWNEPIGLPSVATRLENEAGLGGIVFAHYVLIVPAMSDPMVIQGLLTV